MQLSEATKKKLAWVFAIVLIVAVAAWMIFNPGPEHIEDTNGPDNYALQTINEHDVLAQKMSARGSLGEAEAHLDLGNVSFSSGTRYSSKKFTGVQLLYHTSLIKGSDIVVNLADFNVKSGNFAFYVVFDGEIVGEVKPDDMGLANFRLDNVNKSGLLEYVVAGESANVSFVAPLEW